MVYFISDAHLGLGSRSESIGREERLCRFLESITPTCTRLVIVGDLFDFWFEYKTAIPRHFLRILSQLLTMRRAGIPIDYVIGNHDFGHNTFFQEELGITPIRGDLILEIEGKRILVTHGDGKAYKDGGYRILKRIIQHPISLMLYRWLHPDIGIRLASHTSEGSRAYTDQKNFGERDGLRDYAESQLRGDFDIVVMGHRHLPQIVELEGGVYVNLGDWISYCSYATMSTGTIQLSTFEDQAK